MAGSRRKQEAEQALWPAIFAYNGAEGEKQFQFRAQQEQFEEPSDIRFHHTAELSQINSWIFKHRHGGTIRNIEMRGGALLVTFVDQRQPKAPGFKPLVCWDTLDKIVPQSSFPIRRRFHYLPTAIRGKLRGRRIHTDC